MQELAARMETPSAPVVWRAGWGGRLAAAVFCGLFVAFVDRPDGGTLTTSRPGALFFAVWTSLVAAWVCCRLALWRVTADHDGVHLRGMWTVRLIPWSKIGRVELRNDGLLEFVVRDGEPMGGLFLPAWAGRLLRRSSRGTRTADVLTVLAHHAELRPTSSATPATKGSAFAGRALPMAAVLYAVTELLHR
ncbi:hypothetical protein [Streptomyces sp. enrichment culture]|uniref:hypothetical protein n=1 Tax=Streptomyces sp. enrichment culture TaxID=1795815 RepID=UPI003F5618CA